MTTGICVLGVILSFSMGVAVGMAFTVWLTIMGFKRNPYLTEHSPTNQ